MLKSSVIRMAAMMIGFMSLVLVQTLPARADQIDGNWCNKDGKTLFIDGPKIVTPGRAQITGEYDRHHFTYVSPTGEDHAGETLYMSQLSEQRMNMRLPDGSIEAWSRCDVTS